MRIIMLRFPYTPAFYGEVIFHMARQLEYDIAGVVTFDLAEKETSYKGCPIYPLNDINNLNWDIAIYACDENDFNDIRPRMIELGIGKNEQFKNMFRLLQQLMMIKYEDCADPVIQETLAWWKTHGISVFNQHIQESTLDKVYFDEACNLPYINFKTVGGDSRRMYYPKNYNGFHIRNGEIFVKNLLTEQVPTSPHLYIKGKHKVNPGDIVIDAGVCEGNFALRYVDICSKMYLFEPEEIWLEPLRQTFKNYRDKVEIIPRFVSDKTGGNNITLDDALINIRGKNIFLKMDIEGAEPLALRGAKKFLTNNKVRASVCSYHKTDDLVRIKSILQSYGYKTSTSAGYMVFIYDPNIFKTADFRKGVVYAEN